MADEKHSLAALAHARTDGARSEAGRARATSRAPPTTDALLSLHRTAKPGPSEQRDGVARTRHAAQRCGASGATANRTQFAAPPGDRIDRIERANTDPSLIQASAHLSHSLIALLTYTLPTYTKNMPPKAAGDSLNKVFFALLGGNLVLGFGYYLRERSKRTAEEASLEARIEAAKEAIAKAEAG